MKKIKYLIIGNGMAALSAAREIRKNDEEASITMITNESSYTYYRVKLTEYLSKKFEDSELLVSKEEWYDENNIEVILNKIVEKIDIDKKKIRLDDGKEIAYEKLLIASGSRPFIPPIAGKFKKGVFALRTIADVKYIQEYLEDCEEVAVIGGGLLGLEAAWSLKKLGKKVSLIQHGEYLLPRQLDKEISKKLEEKLLEAGITIYLNSDTKEILGDQRADGIKLNGDRKIKTDAILVSTGIRPNLDLVIDTDINYDKGIKVDENLKTNVKNIYAAGDVIEKDGMVLGLWTAANEQGKIVGANMTGGKLEYNHPKLFTNLQIGDIKLFSAGTIDDFDKVYEEKNEEKGIFNKIFAKKGKIVGAILFGELKDVNNLRNAVMSKVNVDEYIKDGSKFI